MSMISAEKIATIARQRVKSAQVEVEAISPYTSQEARIAKIRADLETALQLLDLLAPEVGCDETQPEE